MARTGGDGAHPALSEDYAVIVLDVMLSGADNWSVLRAIGRSKQTPVLFLTARDAVDDRVKGLELGADDYLVKPFAFSELLARLRSLLRRGQMHEPDTLGAGDLVVDLLKRTVVRGEQRIDLTAKEFTLLSVLRQGR